MVEETPCRTQLEHPAHTCIVTGIQISNAAPNRSQTNNTPRDDLQLSWRTGEQALVHKAEHDGEAVVQDFVPF
jgi:hypothetical protein